MRKVGEHSELLYAQYLARCLGPDNFIHSITTRNTPKRWMKEILFPRFHNTVVPMRLANDKKATLQAIHTDAVEQPVNSQERNVALDDCPPPINNSEKHLTRKEPMKLAQLRSGYCRIEKDASLNIWADCGKTPRDVCLAHPMTRTLSDL